MPFRFAEHLIENFYNQNNITPNQAQIPYNPTDLNFINLYIPGYRFGKDGTRDYRFNLNGNNISHVDMNNAIYRYVRQNNNSAIDLSNLLNDIFQNGLNVNLQGYNNLQNPINIAGNNYNFNEFIKIIYWLIAQEDINFPRTNGKMGVKLPLSRYQEAIIVAINPNFNIQLINNRTDVGANKRMNGGRYIQYRCCQGLPNNLNIPRPIMNNVNAL